MVISIRGVSFRLAVFLSAALGLGVAACTTRSATGERISEERQALTAPTTVSTFAFLATGHVTVRDRTSVTGGDIGVGAGTGDSINAGIDTRVGIGRGLIGQRIVLQDRAAAGNLFVTQLVLGSQATFASQSPFSAPPVPPPIAAFTPGTTPLTVNSGQTVTRAGANFGQVTVNGTLNLSGGTYQIQGLTLGPDGAVVATAPSIVRVAGRVSGADRARIAAAAPQNASALRLVVNGANDTTGGVVLGNDARLNALVIDRAVFRSGDRFVASGAIAARDITLGHDSTFTFNTGFTCNTNAGCNDNNTCTTDTCLDGRCVHTAVTNGTACPDDGNTCTNDRCTNGVCAHPAVPNGTLCPDDGSICTNDRCTNGACAHPAVPDGTACGDDGNECTSDLCSTGTCTHGAVMDGIACTDDGNECTSDLCSTGTCSHDAVMDGIACTDDANGCTDDACSSGLCVHPPADGLACADDGNECTGDACLAGACGHAALTDGVACTDDGDPSTSDSCLGGQCTHPGGPVDTAENCAAVGASCAPTPAENADFVCIIDPENDNGTCQFGTCADQHAQVVRDNSCSSGIFFLRGYATAPATKVFVDVLLDDTENPADCAASWSGLPHVSEAVSSSTPAAFGGAVPLYEWEAEVEIPDQWPNGGLARVRVYANPAFTALAASFEDIQGAAILGGPFSEDACVAANANLSFQDLVAACAGSSIFNNTPCTSTPRTYQVVTAVDGNPAVVPPDPAPNTRCAGQIGNFLTFREPQLTKPDGSVDCDYAAETELYYDVIDSENAPGTSRDTLGNWKTANGYPGTGDINTKYYNAGDLGVGRDMHCWSPTPAGGSACYVTNFGASFANGFKGADESIKDAILNRKPVATVAMEYNPNVNDKVRFFVFNGNPGFPGKPPEARLTAVQLDTEVTTQSDGTPGKPVPGNCLNCHGGRYDETTHTVVGANFLPFDTCSFQFATSDQPGWTLSDQEDDFRAQNQIVIDTQAPDSGITKFVRGMYHTPTGPLAGPLDTEFVPTGWAANPDLYLDVAKPYCRTCHVSLNDNESGPSQGQTLQAALNQACGTRAVRNPMPHAEATMDRFWTSSARAVMIDALNDGSFGTPIAGSCSPGVLPPNVCNDWHASDLKNVGGGTSAAGGSIVAYTTDWNQQQHVVTVGADRHVHELFFTENDDRWHPSDLTVAATTATVTVPLASPGTALAGFTTDNQQQHVIFLSDNGDVHELFFTENDDRWHYSNLSRIIRQRGQRVPAAMLTSPLVGYQTNFTVLQEHIFFLTSDGHIHELFFTANNWNWRDLMDDFGFPEAQPTSALTGFTTTLNSQQHIAYIAQVNGHLDELFFDNDWHWNDLTARALPAAPDPKPGTPLTGYETTFGGIQQQHIDFVGVDDHVHEFMFDTAWHWRDLFDFASISTETAATQAIRGYATTFDGQQHVISVIPGSRHIRELFFDGVRWRARDLTNVPVPPAPALAATSQLTGFQTLWNNQEHVNYIVVNGDIEELFL
jgi:hypothetical protein